MAVSPTHNGWRWDSANSRMDIYYRGTKVGHVSATEFELDQAFDCDGTADFAGDVKFNSTITAGADGVGADGEQLTSGGAAAECDWAAAGSLRAFKNILGIRTDTEDALKAIVDTPVYDFKYKRKGDSPERITSTGDVETVYTGIMADEAPWAMHHNGRILNPINALGYTMLAIKALATKVEEQAAELRSLRAQIA